MGNKRNKEIKNKEIKELRNKKQRKRETKKKRIKPSGGSNVMILPARNRLTGSLGVISRVRNSLKLG